MKRKVMMIVNANLLKRDDKVRPNRLRWSTTIAICTANLLVIATVGCGTIDCTPPKIGVEAEGVPIYDVGQGFPNRMTPFEKSRVKSRIYMDQLRDNPSREYYWDSDANW